MTDFPSPNDLDGIGWKRDSGNVAPQAFSHKPFFPTIRTILNLLPFTIRVAFNAMKALLSGKKLFIDPMNTFRHNAYTGVPIGGIGCGAIGTDFRGGFNRFSSVPGYKEQTSNIKANQFILRVATVKGNEEHTIYQSILSCASFKGSELSSWKSELGKEDLRYRGLYPRAWREFKIDHLGLTVVMEQISPIFPNDYEDTSLPVGVFAFSVINNSTTNYKVTLAFTFRNGTGLKNWKSEGVCRSHRIDEQNYAGMVLQHAIRGIPVTYSICCEKDKSRSEVSTSSFDPTGDGAKLWDQLQDCGCLEDIGPCELSELGVAVAQKTDVLASSNSNMCFSLSWYMPDITFGAKGRTYKRRYSRFIKSSKALCDRIFDKWRDWRRRIIEWQEPVLKDNERPEWYRSALFNESYYITDGSSVWVEYDDDWTTSEPSISSHSKEWFRKYGRFAYMESWEYYMFNTYDVHFYASWAFLKNWPALEMSVQLDYVDQFYREDAEKALSWMEGEKMSIKTSKKIPHDLGQPFVDPWLHVNAYLFHDTRHWKDLNLKFIPMCWRDWKRVYSKEIDEERATDLLESLYEKCKIIIDDSLLEWDVDNDGMIENSGMPDQTYDIWTMTGTSAYCGSLWLCGLQTVVDMGKKLGNEKDIEKYSEILEKAASAFVGKLWNGQYFKFDETQYNSNVIMADQLCGFWWLKLNGQSLPIPEDYISAALDAIYKYNVSCHFNGSLGPVNGMMDTGDVDERNIESEEVWTGTAYALASLAVALNKKKEGLKVVEGMYNSCWNRFGLQYQTPEAVKSTSYRALGYMRPLSIWAMEEAFKQQQ